MTVGMGVWGESVRVDGVPASGVLANAALEPPFSPVSNK